MKYNRVFTILLVFLYSLCYSQIMPIDFSETFDNFSTFGNSGFSLNTDPEDSSNNVGQFYNDGSNIWQGFYIDLSQPIDLDAQQVITLSFYQFDPNAHNIMLKLEQGENTDVEVVQSTSGTGWKHEISFDFSNAKLSGTATAINATGTYSRLTIFIDGGVTTSGTYLIDNIDDGTIPTDPHELDVLYTDLVWSDEFDYTGVLNDNKWFHQTQLPSGGSWFNGEQQHYTNRIDNSYVYGGFMNIVAKKESFTDQGETKQYTSARLNSKFAFTYGRVDVRAKLPFGNGTWPAIWTLGKNIIETGAYWSNTHGTVGWPHCGEIDIMEHGLSTVNHVSSALHTSCAGCYGSTVNYQSTAISDVANNFHVYSVNWSPNQITFLIDGVGFYTYNPVIKDDTTWPFYQDQYLLLNIAMGGVAGTIDPNFTSSNMVIDYVRIYQNSALSTNEMFATALSIFPNPSSDYINITSERTIDNVELFNAIGQLVLSKKHNVNRLSIKDMVSGVYILKLYSGKLYAIKKILIN